MLKNDEQIFQRSCNAIDPVDDKNIAIFQAIKQFTQLRTLSNRASFFLVNHLDTSLSQGINLQMGFLNLCGNSRIANKQFLSPLFRYLECYWVGYFLKLELDSLLLIS